MIFRATLSCLLYLALLAGITACAQAAAPADPTRLALPTTATPRLTVPAVIASETPEPSITPNAHTILTDPAQVGYPTIPPHPSLDEPDDISYETPDWCPECTATPQSVYTIRITSYQTGEPDFGLLDFYREQMPRLGWTLRAEDPSSLVYKYESAQLTVYAQVTVLGTSIMITEQLAEPWVWK